MVDIDLDKNQIIKKIESFKFRKNKSLIKGDLNNTKSRMGGVSIVCGDSLRFDNVCCLLETKQFNINSLGVMYNV